MVLTDCALALPYGIIDIDQFSNKLSFERMLTYFELDTKEQSWLQFKLN